MCCLAQESVSSVTANVCKLTARFGGRRRGLKQTAVKLAQVKPWSPSNTMTLLIENSKPAWTRSITLVEQAKCRVNKLTTDSQHHS